MIISAPVISYDEVVPFVYEPSDDEDDDDNVPVVLVEVSDVDEDAEEVGITMSDSSDGECDASDEDENPFHPQIRSAISDCVHDFLWSAGEYIHWID